ncbi:MAG TPA: DUF2017 family protein [Ilumatobacter sp.]|nr:DUF2017 family protein [Ilumatobacter sp.]
MRRRRSPVRESGNGFLIELGEDESMLVVRLLDELRQLLTNPAPDSSERLLVVRLFPVAHPDDEAAEAEYQRLMRDDLVQSKLEAIERVETVLTAERKSDRVVDEVGLLDFMQSLNAIRLVLGTMLGVTDDPTQDEVDDRVENSAEYHLYAYLSWLLEHCVRAAAS